MPLNQTIPTLRLPGDENEDRASIANAVNAIIASRTDNPRLRIVLAADRLSNATIAALITQLRKLRERGGAIELTAETESARATMYLNGLERVFAFPLLPDEEATRVGRRGGLGGIFRGAAAAAALIVALAGSGSPAKADPVGSTDPSEILAHVMQRNPDLSSYQSRLHVDVRLISFPFISQHLDGSTYFKRPANYEVVFDRVPSYARGFEKLYSDIGDPTKWEQRFAITYAGEKPFENRTDLVLTMVQRVRGMIDHETVFIDPTAWTIDRIRYDYYNGGVVTMTQHFSQIDGYTMLSSQVAEFRIPHVHAVANGTYSDYRTNVAISDAVFTKKN